MTLLYSTHLTHCEPRDYYPYIRLTILVYTDRRLGTPSFFQIKRDLQEPANYWSFRYIQRLRSGVAQGNDSIQRNRQ
jgi:hypothetical protein